MRSENLTHTEQINQWRPRRRGDGAGKQRHGLEHAFTGLDKQEVQDVRMKYL